MHRRQFVKSTSGILPALSLLPVNLIPQSETHLKANHQIIDITDFVNQLIEKNDNKVEPRIQSQILDTDSPWYGGSPNQYDIPNAGSSCALIRDLSCAYVSPGSRYFKSEQVLESIERASQFLLNIQYEDGTVDLHTTNFHSPPDTAFRVEPLALSYHLLRGADPLPEKVLGNLKQFLQITN
jgi:hypothetical protein